MHPLNFKSSTDPHRSNIFSQLVGYRIIFAKAISDLQTSSFSAHPSVHYLLPNTFYLKSLRRLPFTNLIQYISAGDNRTFRMVTTPNSVGSPSPTGSLASATAQDIGRVNPHCEAQSTDCRTDCFNMRKIVAHIFGRNKACTAQIPEHCWVEWCRKHYQRLRHRMLEQGWIFLQINCLKTQLGRMEEWGQVQSWTIVLQHKFQEELDREDAAQKPEDEDGLRNSTKITVTSKDDHTKEHTKTSPNRFLHFFLGEKKSFHEVYAAIDAVEKAAKEGQLISFPPLQFLPLIDATLHPPPPVARPRKQRKPKIYKNKAHNNILNNDSDLEALLDGDNAKSSDSSSGGHHSPALESLLSLDSTEEQVAAEPLPLPLVTTRSPATTVSEHEFQYIVIDESGASVASAVITNSTDSEIVNGNSLPVTQQSSSHKVTRNQVAGQTSPLSIFSTSQDQVGAFADGMQGSGVDNDEDEDSAALILRLIAEDKELGIQVAQSSAKRERGSATKKSSGGIGSSNSPENTHNSRYTLLPAAVPQKMKTPPPGSSSIIDKDYGLIGYKTAKSKSGNTAPSPARRPHLHSGKLLDKTSALASTEPMNENNHMKFDQYPMDPSRTYKPAPNQATRQIEASTAVKTDSERTFPIENHSSEDKLKNDFHSLGLDNENPIASMPKGNFIGWTPINAQRAKTPIVMSIGNLLNADNYTNTKRTLAPDCDTITNNANPKRLALARSSSTNGDCDTDQSSSGILTSPITCTMSKPSPEMTGPSTRKKRLGIHGGEGSPQEGQPLGKRRMRATF